MKVLNIDDIVEIKYKGEYKLYKLFDIAVWKAEKTVATIRIREVKVPFEYPVPPREVRDKKENALRNKAKFVFNDNDRFIIKPFKLSDRNQETIYEIHVRTDYKTQKHIIGVSFQKMMTT